MKRNMEFGGNNSMRSVSAPASFNPYPSSWRPERERSFTDRLCDIADYLYRIRVQMRYGSLSRSPLTLLRLQVLSDAVECDWMARSPDPWDSFLQRRVARRHASLQVLRDAIDLRSLLFRSLPDVNSANFRMYRQHPTRQREIILVGLIHRNDHSARDIHSLSMRAKILGFRFRMEEDYLCNLMCDD
jgi:hypothetical protein